MPSCNTLITSPSARNAVLQVLVTLKQRWKILWMLEIFCRWDSFSGVKNTFNYFNEIPFTRIKNIGDSTTAQLVELLPHSSRDPFNADRILLVYIFPCDQIRFIKEQEQSAAGPSLPPHHLIWLCLIYDGLTAVYHFSMLLYLPPR